MNFYQRWLDKKLQLPMSYTLRHIRKDPQCKNIFCGPQGIRTDVRLGKLMGGGHVYCSCVTYESDTKDEINLVRKFFGLKELK